MITRQGSRRRLGSWSKAPALATMLLAGLAIPVSAFADESAPQRIVSLNLCADELVLRLADRKQVRSVTWLSHKPAISSVAELAEGIPTNRGLAAEIVPLDPDLVVAGIHTTRTAVALLRRLEVPVIELDVPTTIDAVKVQILDLATVLGQPRRGAAMVAEMDRQLAALGPPPANPRLSAAVYRPNGFTAGRDSLIDDILRRAGLRNLAAERGLENYGQLPLEILILAQPDLLILNAANEPLPSLAHQFLRHPGMGAAFPHYRTLVLPPRLWTCGGPGVVEAIARLHQARARLDAVDRLADAEARR